ncbi:MAG TPA: apolipoprotein N-acyltransferase [Acidisarcina sp.]|nr:apolipoprotein N-acyltransferase [Acidisarcina sp.]
MNTLKNLPWVHAVLSAFLLLLPFPIAGPVPWWRTVFGWAALVPLIFALLHGNRVAEPHYLRRSALLAYLTGVLWYLGNCYWIYQTMFYYGGISAAASAAILLGYSLVLGLYFALFGFFIALMRKSFGRNLPALLAVPIFWVALEFAASRITSVPWDQLGYSQVENYWLTRIATITGVYGLSFLLASVSALLAAALLAGTRKLQLQLGVVGLLLAVCLQMGHFFPPPQQPTQATAVLMQPNLSVKSNQDWVGADYDAHAQAFSALSKQTCGTYIAGMPETGAPSIEVPCTQPAKLPAVIVWPEAPTAFRDIDPRFQDVMRRLATETGASVIAGIIGIDVKPESYQIFNSAQIVAPSGQFVGRYDKIHLVPFGEYVPFKNLLTFAGHLTRNVSDFGRGEYRKVFRTSGHRYGVFICYESIFADEVRQFAVNGAEVFVNISDDGWYGDTSAPWQHLNMARMRAIENRRWILRDTNNGTTTIIDPYGRLTVSIPRNQQSSLYGSYGFRDDLTFYSTHGDIFAILCAIIAIVATARAGKLLYIRRRQILLEKTGLLT